MNALAGAVQWWTQLYASHDVVQLAAAGGHLTAIAYAARFALRGDRAALRLTSRAASATPACSGQPASQQRASLPLAHSAIDDITTITHAHRHVITGLCFALITGIAQLAAQLDYLPQSPIFWTKMGTLVLLLANGRMVQLAGRTISRSMAVTANTTHLNTTHLNPTLPDATQQRASRSLHNAAIRSIALWAAMLLLGLLLTTVRPG